MGVASLGMNGMRSRKLLPAYRSRLNQCKYVPMMPRKCRWRSMAKWCSISFW